MKRKHQQTAFLVFKKQDKKVINSTNYIQLCRFIAKRIAVIASHIRDCCFAAERCVFRRFASLHEHVYVYVGSFIDYSLYTQQPNGMAERTLWAGAPSEQRLFTHTRCANLGAVQQSHYVCTSARH